MTPEQRQQIADAIVRGTQEPCSGWYDSPDDLSRVIAEALLAADRQARQECMEFAYKRNLETKPGSDAEGATEQIYEAIRASIAREASSQGILDNSIVHPDTERLDWLESIGFSTTPIAGTLEVPRPMGVHDWRSDGVHGWTAQWISAAYSNARDAIDAARRGAASKSDLPGADQPEEK